MTWIARAYTAICCKPAAGTADPSRIVQAAFTAEAREFHWLIKTLWSFKNDGNSLWKGKSTIDYPMEIHY